MRLAEYRYDKKFAMSALSVMVPVVLQQLISALFNVADNLMVGTLNAVSMSAVTVANKPYIFYTGVFFGVTGGAGILLSQYFGAGDTKQCQRIFATEMLLGLGWSLLYSLVLLAFPEQVMRIFVSDEATVQLGVDYLRLISFSYIPAAVSMVCVMSARCLGLNRIPTITSVFTIGLNVTFNYIFIFGKLGVPAMGVQGAALGTLLARLIELVFYLFLLMKKKMFFSLDLKCAFRLPRHIWRSFVQRATPLTLNELLFSAGFMVFFWCYSHIDETALPALSIAEMASQMGNVLSSGVGSSVSVLIGTLLGASRFEEAKSNTKKLLSLALTISLMGMALGCTLAFVLPPLYSIGDGLRTLASKMTLIYSMSIPLSVAYLFCFFVLRAGGDTKSATLLDSVYMWIVPIPVALCVALFFPQIGIVGALLITQSILSTRLIPSVYFLRKGKWVRNITLIE